MLTAQRRSLMWLSWSPKEQKSSGITHSRDVLAERLKTHKMKGPWDI